MDSRDRNIFSKNSDIEDPFIRWTFIKKDDNYLIKNDKTDKYLCCENKFLAKKKSEVDIDKSLTVRWNVELYKKKNSDENKDRYILLKCINNEYFLNSVNNYESDTPSSFILQNDYTKAEKYLWKLIVVNKKDLFEEKFEKLDDTNQILAETYIIYNEKNNGVLDEDEYGYFRRIIENDESYKENEYLHWIFI